MKPLRETVAGGHLQRNGVGRSEFDSKETARAYPTAGRIARMIKRRFKSIPNCREDREDDWKRP